MRRLIINADDFGLTPGVNAGILTGHQHGIVTSCTLMINMPAVAEALEIARRTPTLPVGLHLTLTAGRPLTPGASSLTDPDGRFLKLPALAERAVVAELEAEVDAQLQAFLATGLPLSHIDSHHHVHLEMPVVSEIVRERAQRLGVPVRGMAPGVAFTSAFYGADATTPQSLLGLVAGIPEGGALEVMSHPAVVDPELLAVSRYAAERAQELATLTDPGVQEAIAQMGIRLTTYRYKEAPDE